jgi:hypothetical protein
MDDPSEEQLQYPSEKQMQRYQAQHRELMAMYRPMEAEETFFPPLGLRLAQAVSDPDLPHDYRFKYHMIIVAYTSDSLQFELARETLADFARALEATGMSPEEIDKNLGKKRGLLAMVEAALEEKKRAREAREEEYAALSHA